MPQSKTDSACERHPLHLPQAQHLLQPQYLRQQKPQTQRQNRLLLLLFFLFLLLLLLFLAIRLSFSLLSSIFFLLQNFSILFPFLLPL